MYVCNQRNCIFQMYFVWLLMFFKKYIFLNSAIILINQLNQFLIWL